MLHAALADTGDEPNGRREVLTFSPAEQPAHTDTTDVAGRAR
jgi:hypothetical protein